mgnify:CR=1 FL=1
MDSLANGLRYDRHGEELFVERGCGRLTMNMVLIGPEFGIAKRETTLGDFVLPSLEVAGPGMHWVEVSRAVAAEGAPLSDATQAMAEAYDIALVNFYDADAHMGMHRDSDERSTAPVVSLSLGDTCVFRFGNTETRTRPYTDVELRSGDLMVFGGPSRLAYHGVPKVYGGTAPPELGLTGRLNITLRVSGLR